MRHLFIRDDGRQSGDIYPVIEDYIRNTRKIYSDTDDLIHYRMPYRNGDRHTWKLVRNIKNKDGVPELIIIHKHADQFNWSNCEYNYYSLNLNDILLHTDKSFDNTAYLVFYPINGNIDLNELLPSMHVAVKDDYGRLISVDGIKLYDEKHNNELCIIIATLVKVGNLPIYTMFLNNDFIINKVWYTNITESDDVCVYAENVDLHKSIFNPTTIHTKEINNSLIVDDVFVIDMYGTSSWTGVFEPQQDGSELVLDDHEPPSLINDLEIDTDIEYTFDGRYIKFNMRDKLGYIKLSIKTSAFFSDFYDQVFKWSWIVHKK